ncbi:hypothetical protein LXL04_024388 [Taraxacum kok-saghyz]
MKENLVDMKIDIPCSLCPIYNDQIADIQHPFVECEMAEDVWARIACWWRIKWTIWKTQINHGDHLKVVLFANLSSIWACRNEMVSKNRKRCIEIIKKLQGNVFLWLLSRNIFYMEKEESRSFENSYIPENPRTPKPLTFSKNRLRGAKNRSNICPVAKKNFRKNDFFFFQKLCICANFFFVHMSLYNTYLKRFVKKNLKKNAKKKKLHICTKNKKKLHICKRFRSRFFERNNGLGDIENWGSSRFELTHFTSHWFMFDPKKKAVICKSAIPVAEDDMEGAKVHSIWKEIKQIKACKRSLRMTNA